MTEEKVQKKRVTITLDQDLYDSFKRIQAVEKSNFSKLVNEVLREVKPMLDYTADNLELVLENKKKGLHQANQMLMALQNQSSSLMDQIQKEMQKKGYQ